MSHLIEGVAPALVTPFSEDGREVNTKVVGDLLAPLIGANCAAVFVLGATGEPTTQTVEQRKKMAEAVVGEVSNEIPVVIHIGGTSIEGSCSLAAHAQKIGASAISSLPPFPSFPLRASLPYYRAMEIAAPDLPFYAYWRTSDPYAVSADEFVEVMSAVPTFSGVKYTDPDMTHMQDLIGASEGRWNILTGADDRFVDGLDAGSHGAIGATYNFMPNHYVAMFTAHRQGDRKTAGQKQAQANELISLLNQYGVIPATKAILNAQPVAVGPARPNNTLNPWTPAGPELLEEMLKVIDTHGLN